MDYILNEIIVTEDIAPEDLIVPLWVQEYAVNLARTDPGRLTRRLNRFHRATNLKFGLYTKRILAVTLIDQHYQLIEISFESRLINFYCSLGNRSLNEDCLNGVKSFCKVFFPLIGSLDHFIVGFFILT